MKAIICCITSIGIIVLLILIGYTAFGCSIFASSLFKYLKRNSHLTTFIPPPAEPAQAPTKNKQNKSISALMCHCSKSTEANPAVIIILVVWKKPDVIALKTL